MSKQCLKIEAQCLAAIDQQAEAQEQRARDQREIRELQEQNRDLTLKLAAVDAYKKVSWERLATAQTDIRQRDQDLEDLGRTFCGPRITSPCPLAW